MYGIYGIYHKSVYEICQTLSQMNKNYEIYGKKFNEYKQVLTKSNRQAFPIYVIDSLKRAKKLISRNSLSSGLMIICDSHPALQKSNTSKLLYPGLKLKQAISKAISECRERKQNKKHIYLQVDALKLKEVLKVATTYSFLNGIQTALYKITPYSLRKNTQIAIISYFYGDLPYAKLITHLESSNKLKTLLELCKDKQAKALREACIEARQNPGKIEKIAKASGFASFEIVYIIKSHRKSLEEDDNYDN